MYIDKELELSSAQAVTAAAASTNHIDLGAARDIGVSKQLYLLITCDVAAVSAGASTVQFQLQCDDNDSFSSAKTVVQTAAIPKASLVAGYQVILPLPPGLDERYVRAYYNVATADLTAGSFTAQVIEGIQSNKHYADALA